MEEKNKKKKLKRKGEKKKEENGQQKAQLPPHAEFILALNVAEFSHARGPWPANSCSLISS